MSLDNPFDDAFYRFGMSAWLGVDLFFVLSGFLITGILYDARNSEGYFRNFYGRRVLRIFPLYYAFLAITFLLGPLLLGRERFEPVLEDQFWYWTYLTNIRIAIEGWGKPMHLEHFWSLAVEEQFYLLWPLAVYALDRRRLLKLSVACFGLAIGLRFLLFLWLDPVASYVLMPTRLDALGAGAFVALVMRGPDGIAVFGPWPKRILLGAAAFAVAIASWRGEIYELDPVIRTVGFAVFAAGFAALIALSLNTAPEAALRSALSSRLLASLAKYSYAMYVVHQPIALLLRNIGLSAGTLPRLWGSELLGVLGFACVASILTGISAFASWHLLEAPCLRLRGYLATTGPAQPDPPPAPRKTFPRPMVVSSRDRLPPGSAVSWHPSHGRRLLTYDPRKQPTAGPLVGRKTKP